MAELGIAANNGDLGGGEMMQLAIATAARDIGLDVQVVGMRHPGGLVTASRAVDVATVELPADGRRAYMRSLRSWWAVQEGGVLWCNGLVPAVATMGMPRRVVHLHRRPEGLQRAVSTLARRRTLATVVPSRYMASTLPGVRVMENWTRDVGTVGPKTRGERLTLGFLGRTTLDKGITVLAEAMQLLGEDVDLVIGGETRFVDARERDEVERALRPLGDRVVRLGWVEAEELFDRVDLAVFPSVWAEPFGLVVAEAMAAECPFVISDAGALREVAGEAHPWVAPAGDPRGLAEAIRSAAGASSATVAQVTGQARDRWQQRYSPVAGQARLAAFWTSLSEGIRSEPPEPGHQS